MARLATSRAGRVLLHLLALAVDHDYAFHRAGIRREFNRSES